MSLLALWLAMQGVTIGSEERSPQAERVLAVAFECGASIRLEPLPPEVVKVLGPRSEFNIRISDRATSKQRACFQRRIPTAKVGFISEPSPER